MAEELDVCPPGIDTHAAQSTLKDRRVRAVTGEFIVML
jgi:hypothetical protein